MRDGPCAGNNSEADVFRERCGTKVANWDALRRRWRRTRGLAIRWHPSRRRSPGALYANLHGAGQLLGLVYRLHSLCMRVQRNCYVSLFDTRFEHYFGYADGTVWAPTRKALGRYNSTAAITLECSRASKDKNFIEWTLEAAVQGADQDAALITVDVFGWVPLYGIDRNQSEVLKAPPVDPCLSRYVTALRDGVRYRKLLQLASPMAVHLRTGFADAVDGMIGSVIADDRAADDWLSAACRSTEPFGGQQRVYVLSDSAGLLRSIARHALHSSVRMRADTAPRNQSSRSWWTTNVEQQFEVLDDMVIAGLSNVLSVAPQLRMNRGGVSVGRQWSSFFWPTARRSMCLTEVRFEVRECPDFESVFPRDLPSWIDLRLPWNTDSKDPHANLHVLNVSSLTAKFPARYERLRRNGLRSARHPCKHLIDAAACYQVFVAANK